MTKKVKATTVKKKVSQKKGGVPKKVEPITTADKRMRFGLVCSKCSALITTFTHDPTNQQCMSGGAVVSVKCKKCHTPVSLTARHALPPELIIPINTSVKTNHTAKAEDKKKNGVPDPLTKPDKNKKEVSALLDNALDEEKKQEKVKT